AACSSPALTKPPPEASPGLVPVEAASLDAPVADAGDAAEADTFVDPCADPGPPVCPPGATWSDPQPVLPPGVGVGEAFGALSLDELHLLTFTAADGGAAEPRVWDRASATEPFALSTPLGFPYDVDGLGLSPDGLRVVGTVGGLPRLQVRAAVGGAFGAPTTGEFRFDLEGDRLRAPVLGPSGTLWFGRVAPSAGTPAIALMVLSGGLYQRGHLVDGTDLQARDGRTLAPTGVSSDLRVLFYYDETARLARVAIRPAPGCVFTSFADLGPRPNAQPNGACTALTYADPTTRAPVRVTRN
ncbi:MAG TPA: hypothetical protein PLR99_06890, partial [Polyangiaceae bacterium]|nr:hypothetical protein [Polyangiaceae bacterium]